MVVRLGAEKHPNLACMSSKLSNNMGNSGENVEAGRQAFDCQSINSSQNLL